MRRTFFLLLACFLSLVSARAELKRYLYLSTPDGAQPGGSGRGILVFDIDDGHRFVKRIDVPFKEGLRGFCGNVKRHTVYYSSTSRRLGAFDLESEKILWERQYDSGCDRACIPPDGSKLYVPTGWWLRGTNSGFLVVNPEDGEVIKRLPAGKHVGFDVVDLKSGKVPHRVLVQDENGKSISHRTHGAGLTPDEKELWISDQDGQKLFIFDATKMPPKQSGHVDLSTNGHGWVTFTLDGKYAWCHTPDVIDVKQRKVVARLKDENGAPVSGSKFLEVHFRDGKVVAMGDQFGLGRASSMK